MNRSFLLAAVFGLMSLGVAGGAAYGVFVVLDAYQEALVDASSTQPDDIVVIVASREIQMGKTIAPDDIAEVPFRTPYVAPTAILRQDVIVGRVARERILAGDLFREERLAPAESGHDLDAVIATGMRARSVNLSGASQVSGFLNPGNRVDVIITVFDDDDGHVTETHTMVQAVRILAVDDRALESAERGIRLKPQVTLELAPEDAEKLTHAERSGKVRLALRSDIDFAWEETSGATTAMLLGGTPDAQRMTLREFNESSGRSSLSVVRIVHGEEEEKEVFRSPR